MILKTHQQTVDLILARVGSDLRIGTPLGLGKPNQLINAIYDRVSKNSDLRLKIFTALTLEIPTPSSDLERRFADPFLERHFGKNYPQLKYAKALRHGSLPANIKVQEFYTAAGQYVGNARGQQDYTSLNYTHVARALVNQGINVLVQLVARRDSNAASTFSLSCNSDLTLDLVDLMKEKNKPLLKIAVIHPDLPYLGGEAEVSADYFDAILDAKDFDQPLFALPKNQIALQDHLIGLHASRTIKDGGTLQIGIGSLSDALVHATLLRHSNQAVYKKAIGAFRTPLPIPLDDGPSFESELKPFSTGLYGTSEMVMDGFMHLRKAGILKREVIDKGNSTKRYLHGGFFLGSKDLYSWLKNLQGADYDGLAMTRISRINDLYDPDEISLRRQRVDARFFNTCAEATLLGGAASDTLRDGQILSGVGGQYNFVAEAAELESSRSILLLRATRKAKGKLVSNIVMGHPHLTIPRHLRDIFITEYGVADLKGRSDQKCCEAMIEIADSRFQQDLIKQAQAALKLRGDYELPAHAKNNTPERLKEMMATHQLTATFSPSPFGSDFTDSEELLQTALLALKSASVWQLLKDLVSGFAGSSSQHQAELERMKLLKLKSPTEFIYQRLVIGALDFQRRAKRSN